MLSNDIGQWVCTRLGYTFDPRCMLATGTCNGDEILGGFLITNFRKGLSVHMHAAGIAHEWITRDLLARTFGYVFNGLEVRRVLAMVEATNEAGIEFVKRIGCHYVATIPDGGRDGDLVVLSMTKDQCRFLGDPNGKPCK